MSHQQELMVEPVMLVETGHTYEAAAIHKWLASSGVCPVSNQKLSSKQTAPNYALKGAIADWAAAHNVTLPPAPVYSTANTDRSRSAGSATVAAAAAAAAAVAASLHGNSYSSAHPVADVAAVTADHGRSEGSATVAVPAAAAAVSMHSSSYSSVQPAAGASVGLNIHNFPGPKRSGSSASLPFRCTRTRWAVAAIALLLLVGLAIGLGVGVPMAMRSSKGKDHCRDDLHGSISY
jgi:hypothetical protein